MNIEDEDAGLPGLTYKQRASTAATSKQELFWFCWKLPNKETKEDKELLVSTKSTNIITVN